MYDQQTKATDDLTWLRTQHPNRTAETAEPESVATESERLAKRAKVVREAENSVGAPWSAAFSALLAERDMINNRFQALMFENQSI